MLDAHRVSQSRWLQRILTWVRGPRLPARTTLGVDPARLYKVSITGVRHTLVTRRTVAADGGPDQPRPAEPRRNLTPRDPDSCSRTSAHLAAFTALNMLLTLLSGPEPKSGQTPATARAAQIVANTGQGAGTRNQHGNRIEDKRTARAKGGGTGTAGRTSGLVTSPARADGLTGDDVRNLTAVLDHAIADNTKANYRSQWRGFTEWARARAVSALPADRAHVAAYLAERSEREGHKPATLRTAAAAIACIHRASGLDDPCASAEVRRVLSGATRKAGSQQKQAAALTAEALVMIRATAHEPRPGRGGLPESPAAAERRGNVDVALISLMRDAMLRVSEAAALTWADIVTEHDGTGRLLIRRSKSDQEGAGAVVYISAPTMARLASIRDGSAAGASVFGLCHNQLAKRIKLAARTAGLGEGFSGHSPRVGMARDLARAGIELPSLMTAGRWRSPAMPALYTRNETAGKGAVAQFYGHRRTPA